MGRFGSECSGSGSLGCCRELSQVYTMRRGYGLYWG